MNNSSRQTLEDYGLMKVITMLLVVLGHVTLMYSEEPIFRPFIDSSFFKELTSYIYGFHMPAFVAISGAIYFYSKRQRNKYTDAIAFITNKAKRLLIPYVFFAAAIVFPTMYFILDIENLPQYILSKFIIAAPLHLWYILMLFNLFVIFNFFEKYIYKAHPAIMLGIFLLINLFVIRKNIIPYFMLDYTFSYMLYFYIGYLFQRYKDSALPFMKKNTVVIFILSINLATFFWGKKIITAFNIEETATLAKGITSFLKYISAFSGTYLLYIISYYCSFSKMKEWSIIKLFSKDSYGIYLFHNMTIYQFFYLTRNIAIPPFLLVLSTFILAISLSLVYIYIFRKLKIQILIGE